MSLGAASAFQALPSAWAASWVCLGRECLFLRAPSPAGQQGGSSQILGFRGEQPGPGEGEGKGLIVSEGAGAGGHTLGIFLFPTSQGLQTLLGRALVPSILS